jgi:hypothetical protein
MADDLGQPRLGKHGGPRIRGQQRAAGTLKRGSNSIEYTIARLEREGRHDLADGIRQRQITAFAARVEMGWCRRPQTSVIDDDHNLTRRRQHELGTVAERPSFADPIPCFSCRSPCAWRALKEISATYMQARQGKPTRAPAGGILPMACCKRQIPFSAEACIA